MKKVVLSYYSRRNLGDDLFVKIFTEYFNDCTIYLITNPCYVPKGLGKNVKVHPFSFLYTFVGKMMSLIGYENRLSSIIQHFLECCYSRIEEKSDAVVEIGGSIFMDKERGVPLDFGMKRKPDYSINSSLQNFGKRFVIGANLGPAYSEEYWDWIKTLFKKYNHVCLRDYSSYYMVKELPYVQYAPDVIFLTKYPVTCGNEENVVISLIDVCQYTTNKDIVSAYYNLLKEVVLYFANKEIKVILTSFCKREGDEIGIQTLINKIPSNNYITTCCYKGDINEMLELFASASFVIASRFHSLILGVLFGKPVFPIAYNCKTENYLYDLEFCGNYAKLNDIGSLKLDDVLFNYKNRIITECSNHKKYAVNQFWGLRKYLEENI